MLVAEAVARIRRAYFVQGKAICCERRVSRKVVRKVLRSEAIEFRYGREDQPPPRIGQWQAELDQRLKGNEARPSRERLTLIRIFEDLRERSYEGSYDAVRRCARGWQRDRVSTSVDAFVPLSFAPGEACQFDCSHNVVLINGTMVTVKVAHVRLCHTRILFVRAYPRETQEMVHDVHEAACGEALREGVRSADAVINILARQREGSLDGGRILTAALQHRPAADPAPWPIDCPFPRACRGRRCQSRCRAHR